MAKVNVAGEGANPLWKYLAKQKKEKFKFTEEIKDNWEKFLID